MDANPKYHVQPDVLAARYDKPSRRQIPASIAENLGRWSPQQHWDELLRSGLIPDTFAKDEDRRFGFSDEQNEIWPDSRPAEILVPNLISDILAVASDPIGMLAAEESARQLALRLLPWKAVCNSKVVWYFNNEVNRYWGMFGSVIDSACQSVLFSTYDVFDVRHFLEYLPEVDQRKIPLSPHVLECFAAYETWFIAADLRLPIIFPETMNFSVWNSIADWKNPFEPLVDIWLRGYRIVPEFTDKDPFIRLYCTRPSSNTAVAVQGS